MVTDADDLATKPVTVAEAKATVAKDKTAKEAAIKANNAAIKAHKAAVAAHDHAVAQTKSDPLRVKYLEARVHNDTKLESNGAQLKLWDERVAAVDAATPIPQTHTILSLDSAKD